MAPRGLAILLGAGPATGTGIARILSHPSYGNYAVAILARNVEKLNELKSTLCKTPDAVVEAFPTNTHPENLSSAFQQIKSHASFAGLHLKVAVFSIKNASVKPFEDESFDEYMQSMQDFAGGAMAFTQLCTKMMFEQQGKKPLVDGGSKKGTIIYTGTLGALRTNPKFASYGGSRAAVRSLAQAVAKEYSPLGIQAVHVIANGSIRDENASAADVVAGKCMSADAVGKTYLWLTEQEPTLWTHELDLRPAQEKF